MLRVGNDGEFAECRATPSKRSTGSPRLPATRRRQGRSACPRRLFRAVGQAPELRRMIRSAPTTDATDTFRPLRNPRVRRLRLSTVHRTLPLLNRHNLPRLLTSSLALNASRVQACLRVGKDSDRIALRRIGKKLGLGFLIQLTACICSRILKLGGLPTQVEDLGRSLCEIQSRM